MLVFLDIETTGRVPNVHNVLEIYAEIYAPLPTHTKPSFHKFICPTDFVWDAECLRMHTMSGLLAECLTNGEPLSSVMSQFFIWISGLVPDERITLAGKAVGRFDLPFLVAALKLLPAVLHHNSLDIGSLLWKPSATMKILSLAELCAVNGLPSQNHRAKDDVRACMALLDKYINTRTDDLK